MSGCSSQRGVLIPLVSCAVFSSAPLLFVGGNVSAAEEKRTPDLEMGARLVEARCTICHNEKGLAELVDRCMARQGEAYLDEFLKRHHAPDDEARADIIAYLTCPPNLLPLQ